MNAKPHTLVRVILTTLFLAVPTAAQAQPEYPYDVDTRPRRGFLTDAMTGSGVDSIDSVSGNLHLQIPIASLAPGPAGSGFALALAYNSSIWQSRVHATDAELIGGMLFETVPVLAQTLEVDAGWRYNFEGYRIDVEKRGVPDGSCDDTYEAWRYRLRIGLPDGSLHTLFPQNNAVVAAEVAVWDGEGFLVYAENGLPHPACDLTAISGRLTYYTVDGTYLKLEIDADGLRPDGDSANAEEWILHYPDGRRVHGRGNRVERIYDANGNWVEFTPRDCVSGVCTMVIRDQYHAQVPGREIRIRHNQAGNYDDIQVPTETGTVTWRVNWDTVTAGSGLTYEHHPSSNDDTVIYDAVDMSVRGDTHRVVESIVLPDAGTGSTNYGFDYDHDRNTSGIQPRWGELTRMTTPTGAVYDYTYQDSLRRFPPNLLRNAVTKKMVTAGTEVRTWTYAYSTVASTTTITGPDGGTTVFAYKDPNGLWVGTPGSAVGQWDRGLIHKITNPDGSVIERTWQRNKVPYVAGWALNPNNPYVAQERFTPSGTSTAVRAATDFTYDKNGNLRSRIEKHWNGTQARKLVQTFHHGAPADESDTANPVTDTPLGYWRPQADPQNIHWSVNAEARRLNAVKRREIWGTGTTLEAVSEFTYDDAFRGGNVTKEVRWDDTQAATAATPLNESLSQVLVRAHHGNGNLSSVSAPEIATAVTYDPLGTLGSPYPTDVSYGAGTAQRSFTYAWNYKTGRLISWADVDNSVTTTYGYDVFGRRTSASEAGSRKTVTVYDDRNLRVTEKRDLEILDDGKLQSLTHYDPRGRVTQVQTTDTASTWITAKTLYSADGLKIITSTPYRTTTDPTLEWTCVQQDSIGRTVSVAVFKGSAMPSSCTTTMNRTGLTQFSYDRNTTRITEYAPGPTATTVKNVVRVESRDALNRLIEVTEDPGPTAGTLQYVTSYSYDGLDNLTQVTQGVQTRTFEYTSLDQLKSARNPESGTVSYTYFDSGNLKTRTDARSVSATYTYDDLHRPKTIDYSDTTLGVTYAYHALAGAPGTANIGRLKSVTSSVASDAGTETVAASDYAYDTLGRVKTMSQTIAGHPTTFSFTATYYLNDALKTQTYPSGRTVSYGVDAAGRVTTVSAGTRTYADMTGVTGHAYAPDGRLRQMKLGNNLWETRDYRTPGTTTRFKLGTSAGTIASPGTSERVELSYDYHDIGNNGNLTGHTITRAGTSWTQDFTYDAANRLKTAGETGGYSRTFGYDQYGNRWLASNTGMTYAESHEPRRNVFNAATNRRLVTPEIDYDAAGNQDKYSPWALGYDAENRMISITKLQSLPSVVVGEGTYTYDGEGRRVKKVWTPPGGAAEDTYYVYDIAGNLAAEYGTGTAPASGTAYPFTDMLGSVRAVTDATGTVVECYDYLPFGRLLSASDNGRVTLGCHPSSPDASLDSKIAQKFTGQVRDEETRLDYFGARYYSGPEGRFLSPDPLSGWPDDVQSWNGYAYARNNPLLYTDPTGLIYELCTPGHACIYDYPDSDFETNFLNDPAIRLDGVSIYRDGEFIGTARHLRTDNPYSSADALIEAMAPRADALESVMNLFGAGVLGAPAIGLAVTASSVLGIGSGLTTLSSGSPYFATSIVKLKTLLGPTQTALLRELFGPGPSEAARSLANFRLPPGLTRRSLEIYKEIAERVVLAGESAPGYSVQLTRLKLVEMALRQLK